MSTDQKANKIVEHMMKTDAFSKWLGVQIKEIKLGYACLSIAIRDEMVNGFDKVHGGITYSLADSALAFASNGHGKMSVALDVSMSYPAAVNKGDVITAEAIEFSKTRRTGIYNITITNQNGVRVGFFKGTVYRLDNEWDV